MSPHSAEHLEKREVSKKFWCRGPVDRSPYASLGPDHRLRKDLLSDT
jgi:hypothetical protein